MSIWIKRMRRIFPGLAAAFTLIAGTTREAEEPSRGAYGN